MCGLVALWDAGLAEPERLSLTIRLRDRLRHRGPDGAGSWSARGAPLSFGHRRLAIQGLGAQGAQPMTLSDGAIIYNGELFDECAALREALQSEGTVFRGRSDTEVLLHALTRWGIERTLEAVLGQFAFAWYDAPRRRLVLARDRLGIRPLCYSVKGGRLAAASEQKALLPLEWVNRAPGAAAMMRYLILGRTDDVPGETMIDGIRSLPAGHWAEWNGTELRLHRYFRIDEHPSPSSIASVRSSLDRAVGGQLISEVPVGVCVSGGLDSSSVALSADRTRLEAGERESLHLFAYHDRLAQADETPYQQAVLDAARSPHEIHWVTSSPADLSSELETYIDHQEEPYGDASSYGEYCLAREARRAGVPVLLNGLGGDEVFLGYISFFGPLALDLIVSGEASALRSLVAVAPGVMGSASRLSGLRPLVAAAYHALPSRARNFASAARAARAEGLSPTLVARAGRDGWRTWHTHDGFPPANAALRGATESWCIPRYLAHSDRMGLAHGVENRVPLLDPRLIEAAYGIPPGERVGATGLKSALRAAAADLLPPLVRDRAWKLGFHVPLDPYVQALDSPLRDGWKAAGRLLGEAPRWEGLPAPSRWRWGMLGLYLDWVGRQPVWRGTGGTGLESPAGAGTFSQSPPAPDLSRGTGDPEGSPS